MSVKREDMIASIAQKTRVGNYDEDAIHVDRFLSGDRLAFDHLYAEHFERVYAIAKGILLNTEEALDAVQETFTLVYKNLARFDHKSKFSTWLYRIAVNRSIQNARKNKNKWRFVELNEALTTQAQSEEPNSDPRVHRALARLKPEDRAILTLFYWEDLSLEQIAEAMSIRANAAKTRLYRARERFRELYEGVAS